MFRKIALYINVYCISPLNDWLEKIAHKNDPAFLPFLVETHRPYVLPVVQNDSSVVQDQRYCVACEYSVCHLTGPEGDEQLEYVLCTRFPEMVFRSVVTGTTHAPSAQMMRNNEKFCGVEARYFEPHNNGEEKTHPNFKKPASNRLN